MRNGGFYCYWVCLVDCRHFEYVVGVVGKKHAVTVSRDVGTGEIGVGFGLATLSDKNITELKLDA